MKILLHNTDPNRLNAVVAAQLKGQLQPPSWAAFVKTGVHKERPPADPDWWYARAAALLRTIYLRGPIGTEKLRARYGGRKDRGHAPERFSKGSGNVIRTVMQQLEKAGFVAQGERGVHKGRLVTAKGAKLLHEAARKVAAE